MAPEATYVVIRNIVPETSCHAAISKSLAEGSSGSLVARGEARGDQQTRRVRIAPSLRFSPES